MCNSVKYLSVCLVLGKMLFTQNKKERLNLSLFLVMYDCYIKSFLIIISLISVVSTL